MDGEESLDLCCGVQCVWFDGPEVVGTGIVLFLVGTRLLNVLRLGELGPNSERIGVEGMETGG